MKKWGVWQAKKVLKFALENSGNLGKRFFKLWITARMSLHITDQIIVVVGSDILDGVLYVLRLAKYFNINSAGVTQSYALSRFRKLNLEIR